MLPPKVGPVRKLHADWEFSPPQRAGDTASRVKLCPQMASRNRRDAEVSPRVLLAPMAFPENWFPARTTVRWCKSVDAGKLLSPTGPSRDARSRSSLGQ